jgi:hypothetical protein
VNITDHPPDFKTELKRLGIKRIRNEEKRRQSFALVLDDKDVDENGELEFADALNTSPSRLAEQRGPAQSPSSARGRLRNESVQHDRPQVGQGGKRLSQLPGLGIAKGWANNVGSKFRSRDPEYEAADVVRSGPEQDPFERAPAPARPPNGSAGGEGPFSDRRDSIDSIDELAGSSAARRKRRDPYARLGISGEDHAQMSGSRKPSDTSMSGAFDEGAIDFQTKPAGL